jgi:2'-5' RNA ligase
MIRAFFAVELSEPLRACLAQLQQELRQRIERETGRDARIAWVQPASLHLTLKFLGDTEEKLIEPLHDAIAQTIGAQQAVSIPIARVGAFPRLQGPRVIWVGPTEDWERGTEAKRLAVMQRQIEEACEGFGFVRETKPFNPHLTLARIKNGERAVGLALTKTGAADRPLELGALAVNAVVLMKSDLKPTGSVYTKLWEVRLSGT